MAARKGPGVSERSKAGGEIEIDRSDEAIHFEI